MKKRMKAIVGACVWMALASALSGCVILPYGHGHGGGYYRDHH